ncbi:MAG TPA: DUF4440 domain-containing protein [Pyrinomonadaceae bacterium]
MKRAALIAFLLAGSFVASGQEAPAAPPAAEEARAAIAANHSKFIGAFGKGDAAAVAALHAADARLLPHGGRPVEGVQNVEAFWAGLLKAGARLVQLQTLSVEERGELAYEVGDYIVTTRPQPGLTAINSGSYLVVWRRQGGEWKLAAAIWNTDKAPER